MAATAADSAGPRYAPDDPTLPKPWRGLVDGKTGYLYFWNPETNVTQYEKPGRSSHGNSLRPSSGYVSSTVQVQQSSSGQRKDDSYSNDGDDKYVRSGSERSQQVVRAENTLHGDSRSAVSNGPAGSGDSLSAEAYRRRHEISVSGGSVPPPFMTFEATGFPSEILKEMRYLLQGGANVVRCAALWAL